MYCPGSWAGFGKVGSMDLCMRQRGWSGIFRVLGRWLSVSAYACRKCVRVDLDTLCISNGWNVRCSMSTILDVLNRRASAMKDPLHSPPNSTHEFFLNQLQICN